MVSRERRTYAALTDTENARGADKSSMEVAAERRARGSAVLQMIVVAVNDNCIGMTMLMLLTGTTLQSIPT
jgi:hypothetical protein